MVAARLSKLDWVNSFVRELPGDEDPTNQVRQVYGAAYSRVAPARASAPSLVITSPDVLKMLGLAPDIGESQDFVDAMTGNAHVDGADYYAMCYGGHQFGNWAGQLGDGRAINLGEVRTAKHGNQTIQLKGAGQTPYSRHADGLAVLRSSIREFLCSEAMHFLGVPTTRALSLTLTGDKVSRDMFYDGRPALEPGAVVCRVAPSFIRFGNFEIFAARKDLANLRRFADYTIRHFFGEIVDAVGDEKSETPYREHIAPRPSKPPAEHSDANTETPNKDHESIEAISRAQESAAKPLCKEVYGLWLEEVARRTAEMVIGWQRVGFVHGVMNTDNMSIHGLTIDYGPYGWLEPYDPNWTPNTTDAQMRRYRFGAQPQIALWSLERLANAIYPLVEEAEPLEAALNAYVTHFNEAWPKMMASKLGIADFNNERDRPLIDDLLQPLADGEVDMTIFFRNLAKVSVNSSNAIDGDLPELIAADGRNSARFSRHSSKGGELPEPIAAAFYGNDPKHRQAMASWLERYCLRTQASGVSDESRKAAMNSVNPKYVFRNYLAQMAIDKAEQGDFSLIEELLEVLTCPYDEQPEKEHLFAKRPEWARNRPGASMLSCSS